MLKAQAVRLSELAALDARRKARTEAIVLTPVFLAAVAVFAHALLGFACL